MRAYGLRRKRRGCGLYCKVGVYRAPKKHISKIRIGISHINPLIKKPNKAGISL